ncbi:hypothetical protein [Paenibacillus sp. NEAU-GSW1]|uniref:hypothetical protein n=1 Tax=Paenibacillus sp. NEAU-GSW1 TaxID=2682486 RepID=UPI001C12C567|nr:hypothetical protein [Paenibacillus sp. NEAU-GSW1]
MSVTPLSRADIGTTPCIFLNALEKASDQDPALSISNGVKRGLAILAQKYHVAGI